MLILDGIYYPPSLFFLFLNLEFLTCLIEFILFVTLLPKNNNISIERAIIIVIVMNLLLLLLLYLVFRCILY